MAISMFGLTTIIGQFEKPDFVGNILSQVVKKSGERRILEEFLRGKVPELEAKAKVVIEDDRRLSSSELNTVFDYCRQVLLQVKTGKQIPVYRDLVLQVIEKNGDYRSRITAERIRQGKEYLPEQLPAEFPGEFKRAEAVVSGKLKSDIGSRELADFLSVQNLRREINVLAKDLFFGVNNGLEKDQVIRFMSVMYELRKLETEQPVNISLLKNFLLELIKKGEKLDLLHVKCLRFIYPKEGGVKILRDTEDVVVEGYKGKYLPKSEGKLFERLNIIREIFMRNGIGVDFTICCSDEDLDLLFPEGSKYVTEEQRVQMKEDAGQYMSYLASKYSQEFKFSTIGKLSQSAGNGYASFRNDVVRSLMSSENRYVNPGFFERDRVDHQFSYYQQLLGSGYSRAEARRSVAEQTASVIALRELIPVIGPKVILVEENRYGENKLIANGEAPVLFVKLRDEAIFY